MRPHVTIFSAQTLDGKIASSTGYTRIGCDEEVKLLHAFRARSDAVMVGANTAAKDDPRLTVRLASGRSPLRIIVDPNLRISPHARAFRVPGKAVLITLEKWGEEALEEHRKRGITVIRAGAESLDLERALRALYELGVRRLLVEGGGRLNCSLLSLGLVDELRVTIAPFIFGDGVSLAVCGYFDGERSRVELALVEHYELCPGWIHAVYRVLRPKRGID